MDRRRRRVCEHSDATRTAVVRRFPPALDRQVGRAWHGRRFASGSSDNLHHLTGPHIIIGRHDDRIWPPGACAGCFRTTAHCVLSEIYSSPRLMVSPPLNPPPTTTSRRYCVPRAIAPLISSPQKAPSMKVTDKEVHEAIERAAARSASDEMVQDNRLRAIVQAGDNEDRNDELVDLVASIAIDKTRKVTVGLNRGLDKARSCRGAWIGGAAACWPHAVLRRRRHLGVRRHHPGRRRFACTGLGRSCQARQISIPIGGASLIAARG
jgi:hypothetical protein